MLPGSRLLFVVAAHGAWFTIGVMSAACGGSSSETPFPLEPDPRELAAGAPRSGPYVAPNDDRNEPGESDEAGRAAPPTCCRSATKRSPPNSGNTASNEAPQAAAALDHPTAVLRDRVRVGRVHGGPTDGGDLALESRRSIRS